jgi:outer membrane receptor protein involved in Fe transport
MQRVAGKSSKNLGDFLMARNLNVRNAVKLALAVNAGLIGMSAAPGAFAQEENADQLEEITVTGSRIKKKDFSSNAPVATVGVEQIEMTGTVNTESLLNTLPQAVPGLDRTSNNPGNGTATVNLRGLGSNRTLVLINGTRVVPTGSGGSVDINTIPNALIENIEVLTGGASAVYGSDAIAGVVNFILKDDFEGVNINAGFEQTFDGDAGIWSTDLTLGANTADGRGNVTLNFAYTDREELFQGDRDFSFFAQFDDGEGNLYNGGSSGIPGTSIFSGALEDFSPTSFGVTFDQNGNIREFDTSSGPGNDFYNYAPVNYIQLPQTRYQTTALGHYDLSERVTVYGRGHFTSSFVPQQLAATPIFQSGTQVTLDGNPFLTPLSQQVLSDAFGDGVDTSGNGIDDTGTMFVRRRMLEVGERRDEGTFTSFSLLGGIKGDISESWSFDGYYQVANVNGSSTQNGNVDRNRFLQALILDPADPTQCANPAAGGSTVACAPMNIFGEGNISPEAAAFVRTAVASAFDYGQDIIGLNFTGDLFGLELPGGEIGVAVGYEHRQERFDFRPSQALASGNIAGFNGAPPVSGGFTVSSYYAEAYLPILSGVTGFDQLDLELAFRSEDYNTSGSIESYKVGASWAPVESFRFRGGFNRAVRAPSIGELFSPQGENFPSATDPCSALGAPTAATEAICIATGVPANVVGTPAINLAAGQVRAVTGGNPNLLPEEADTYTVGFVFQPDFIEGLNLSIDYFDILIDGYITEFGGGASQVLTNCYTNANPADGGVGSPWCSVVNRRSDGTIDNISLSSANVAEQTLKGFDILATYDFDLFDGDMRINYVATVTQESNFTAYEGAETDDCSGAFGQTICGEPLPEYKHRATATWSNDNLTGMLSWRYVGEVDDDDPSFLNYAEKIDGFNYFDLSGTYRFTDNYSLTVGIDNVADETPPLLGDNQEQANTYPATYDVFGRTYFVRMSAEF